jgi:GNAT superfamily N-acetyltransferase
MMAERDPNVTFVDALQRQAVEEVAFYPRAALERAIARGEIMAAFENGEPCGYLWRGPAGRGRDLVIYQAVVHYDLRRRLHGARRVARVIEEAADAGCRAVRLRCRSSIPANDFWRTLGFICTAVRPGGKRRGADINEWRHDVGPVLFDLSLPPSAKAVDASGYVPGLVSRWDRNAASKRRTA